LSLPLSYARGTVYKSKILCETLPALQDEVLKTDPYIRFKQSNLTSYTHSKSVLESIL